MTRSILMRADRAVRMGQFQKVFIACLLILALMGTLIIGLIACAVVIVLRTI